MTANSVLPSFPTFKDVDGLPLEGGFIYIGLPNLNPEVAPKQAYFDKELTVPAPQPIRTIGGYPSRNGTPSQIYVDGEFSLTVRDKNGALIYNAATEQLRFSPLISGIYDFRDVSTLLADTGSGFGAGSIWRTRSEGFSYEEAPSSATDHHVTTAGGVKLYVLAGADGYASTLAFGALGDGVTDDSGAIETAIRTGLPIDWNGQNYRIASSVSATLTGPVLWRGANAVLTYDPPAHSEFVIALEDTTGYSIVIDDLTIDGQKMCNRGLRVQNNTSNATPSDFTANRINVRNIKRLNTFTGGAGVFLRGAFTSAVFNGGSVVDCELPAGQGTPGTVGIRGIGATWFSVDSYIKRFVLNGIKIEKIYSSDLSYTFDQDGVAYFSPNDPAGGKVKSLFVCEGGSAFKNCYGRSIKTQCRNTNVHDSSFERTEGLTGGVGNSEVNAQTGSCVVTGNVFSYRNGQIPSAVIAPSSTTGWKSGASIRNNEVYLESETVLRIFVGPFPSGVAAPWTRMEVVGNKVLGSVEAFVDFLTNSNKAHLTVTDNWVEEIAPSTNPNILGERNLVYVRASGTTPPEGNYAYVNARSNVYVGSQTVYLLRGRVAGTSMDAELSAYDNFGFVDRWNERAGDTDPNETQAIAARLTGLEADRVKGYFGMQTKTLADGVTETFNFRASNASLIILQTSRANIDYAIISVAATAVGVTVGSGIAVGATANPSTGAFNVWRSGVGEISVQNNSGSVRSVSIWVFAPN